MLSTERSFSSEAKIETTFLTFSYVGYSASGNNNNSAPFFETAHTKMTNKLFILFFPPLSENYSVNLTRVNSAVRRLQLRFTKNGIDTVLFESLQSYL